MKSRKVPVRQCIACGERREKKELLRLCCTAEGEIMFDTSGKKNGRGAYICNLAACLTAARKKHSLDRVWKMPVEDKVYERLMKEWEELGSE